MALGNVLSIVGCVVLSDELSYVLSRDNNLSRAFIIDNEEGHLLSRKLEKKDIETEIIEPSEMHRASIQDRFSVLIWLNDASLCMKAREQRNRAHFAIANLAEHSGLCLCFYGRCHGAFDHLEELEGDVKVPLMVLTDVAGDMVEDCKAASMGGQTEYQRTISSNPDTFFLTPGWVEEWYRNHEHLGKKQMRQSARSLLQENGYCEIMKLDNGLGESERVEEHLGYFSSSENIRVINRLCGLSVFENSYSIAKKMLAEMRPRTLSPFFMRSVPMVYQASGSLVHRMGRTV
jgi:hypothetical protein